GRIKETKNAKILEVGAGTGATSDVVISSIRKKGYEDRLGEYCYTDLSSYFLTMARQRYGEDTTWLKTAHLDINSEEEMSLMARKEKYDLIIAAGVLNNVDNTVNSLKWLANCLSDEGRIIISEAVGEALQMIVSQVFMMKPANDERKESNQTFLSEDMWKRAFTKAGLSIETMTPDANHKLNALGQKVFFLKKKVDIIG
nr:class I SAM-dependent methyltransferase [Parasporobacterium sp.]